MRRELGESEAQAAQAERAHDARRELDAGCDPEVRREAALWSAESEGLLELGEAQKGSSKLSRSE